MHSKYISGTFSSQVLLHFYGEMDFPVSWKVKSRRIRDSACLSILQFFKGGEKKADKKQLCIALKAKRHAVKERKL